MPTTPTASVALIDLILAELQAHLPAALITAGLPAVADWTFGDRELVPATRTPQIQVDLSGYDQPGRFGSDMHRENTIVVIAVIAAADAETLHRRLLGYGDAICGTLESALTPRCHVTHVDLSPSFQFGAASPLFRAVAVEFTIAGQLHTAGAI